MTGAIIAKATDAIIRAEAPLNVPFIKLSPIANSANAPPIIAKPLPMLPHFIAPKSDSTEASILSEATAITNPVALNTDPLGISLIAIAISPSMTPIAIRPLVIDDKLMLERSDSTDANIFIDAAISIIDRPVRTTCLALPAIFSNTEISRSNAPTAANPFPIFTQLIVAKSLHTDANISIDAARKISPSEPLTIFEPVFDITIDTATNSQRSAETATRPTDICSQLRPERDFNADASIRIASDIFIMFDAVELNILLFPPNLFISVMDPTNSANKVVIAIIAVPSESESIVDNRYNAAARIAIAAAILSNAPAFNCC